MDVIWCYTIPQREKRLLDLVQTAALFSIEPPQKLTEDKVLGVSVRMHYRSAS